MESPSKPDTWGHARDIAACPGSFSHGAISKEMTCLLAEIDRLAGEAEDKTQKLDIQASDLDVKLGNIQLRFRDTVRPLSHAAGQGVEFLLDGKNMDHLCWTAITIHIRMEEVVRCEVEFLPRQLLNPPAINKGQ